MNNDGTKAEKVNHTNMNTDSEQNETKDEQSEAMDVSSLESTSRKSVSASADPDFGFAITNELLRSVLMHPMGLPLLFFLNNVNAAKQFGYVKAALDAFNSIIDNRNLRENVFAASVLHWQDGETDLTENLMFNIKHCKIGDLLLTTDREKQIVGNEGQKAFVDYIFSEKKDATGKSSIVALFEFGLQNHNWWTKQHQILKYVQMMRTKEDPNYKIDQPILISAITINEESKIGGASKKRTRKEMSDKVKIATFESNLGRIERNEKNVNDHRFSARFGVFLCTPKGDNEFRISLLWRHTTTTLKEASNEFGRILRAVQLCSYLRKYCNDNKTTIQYKYLGPNCCKIGEKLFRSYDNRLRPTDRRPNLYLKPYTIEIESDRTADTVLEILDKNLSVDFGDLKSSGNERPIDWLWTYQGKLLIISTPYHDGVHYANHPSHFQPIIDHLRQLHERGFVHGDIRAYNMVLQYKTFSAESDQVIDGDSNDSGIACKGWLIDFDYGGKHGEVVYPKGYRHLLDDGRRPGKEGNKITIMDDWKSLIGLIFHTYFFVKKQGAELTNDQELIILKMEKELEGYLVISASSNDTLLSHVQPLINLLQDYINATSCHGYDVKPKLNFKDDLKKCGLWQSSNASEGQSSKASEAATGSPPKK